MGITYKISGGKVYLDTNVFIYLLEGYAEFSSVLVQVFDLIDAGKLLGVTSELSLAEALVKPMSDENLALQQMYKATIQASSVLQVEPITRDVLIGAAKLRAVSNFIRLPDAIHAATAHAHKCQTFLTNDKQLKKTPGLEVLFVSEIKNATLVV